MRRRSSLFLLAFMTVLVNYLPASAQITHLRSNAKLVRNCGTDINKALSPPIQSTYTINNAGIKFDVPAGWKVVTISDGSVVAYASQGAMMVTFVISEQPKETVEGLIFGLKNRLTNVSNSFATSSRYEFTRNGIQHSQLFGNGSLNGRDMYIEIDVLKLNKPVVVFSSALYGIAWTGFKSIRESIRGN